MRVKCLAQEHNAMSPARARTRSARSGVERTNHEATAPPSAALGRPLLNAALVGDSLSVIMSNGFHIFAAKFRVVRCPHLLGVDDFRI